MMARTTFVAAALLTVALGPAGAAEWEEILVTTGEKNAVEMAEGRKVMTYWATGGYALRAVGTDTTVPGGSYECAGMVDVDAEGAAVRLYCATTDIDGDIVYASVVRGKTGDAPPTYSYDGGTGRWAGVMATCTYQVTPAAGGQQIEVARCRGDELPPPLR